MRAYSRLLDYVKQDEFKITINDKSVDVENYSYIEKIDEEKIILFSDKKKIIIKGTSLCINKLLNEEILVMGHIDLINFEDKIE